MNSSNWGTAPRTRRDASWSAWGEAIETPDGQDWPQRSTHPAEWVMLAFAIFLAGVATGVALFA